MCNAAASLNPLPNFESEKMKQVALVCLCFLSIDLFQADMALAQTAAHADFDRDFKVGFPDFIVFGQSFGKPGGRCDLNRNGMIDFPDFLIFVSFWGQQIEIGSDFNFIFNFGIHGQNGLNTSTGTFTKDMVADPSIVVDLLCTENELDRVLSKMTEMDLSSYPDKLVSSSSSFRIPPSVYGFTVSKNSELKKVRWSPSTIDLTSPSEDERIRQFQELIALVRGILESKEEYRNLPEPTGHYM